MDNAEHVMLRAIHQAPGITRRAIADETGLGLPRVGALVSSLLGNGLLREESIPGGMPGRPVGALRINPSAARVVGLDIGGHFSRAVLTDLAGQIVASLQEPTQVVADRNAILDNLVCLVEKIRARDSVAPAPLAGVGVGLRGIVDARTGQVLGWPSTPAWTGAWAGYDLGVELRERLGHNLVLVEDSVRAMGRHAHRFGVARDHDDFLYVFLGSGIGSVLFIGGQPYRGSLGLTGELGHVTVLEDGPGCSCGNHGCLEVLASTEAVLAQVRRRLGGGTYLVSDLNDPFERGELTLEALIAAARAGDKIAFQILDETGNHVGKVIAIAINLLGPDLVILGGPLVKDDGVVLEAVRRQVRLRALQQIANRVRIIGDDHDEFAGARGAAVVALDTLFDSSEQIARLTVLCGPAG